MTTRACTHVAQSPGCGGGRRTHADMVHALVVRALTMREPCPQRPSPSTSTKPFARSTQSKNIDHWDRNLGRYDAEELMAEVLGRKLTPAVLDRVLDGTSKQRYTAMVARRVNGEPIPRIMGHYTFRGLDMLVKDGVFVPRASSELLAAEAIEGDALAAEDVASPSTSQPVPVPSRSPLPTRCAAPRSGASTSPPRPPRSAARTRGGWDCANIQFRSGDMLAALPRTPSRRDRSLHHPSPVRAAHGVEDPAARDPGVRAAPVADRQLR